MSLGVISYVMVASENEFRARFGGRGEFAGPGLYNKESGYEMEHNQSRGVCAPMVMRDIGPFVTQDKVEITSRSKLRAYERTNQVRQCGNDWMGPEKPAFWDGMVRQAKKRAKKRERA